MKAELYPVMGASVPPLLGRSDLLRTLTGHLTKSSPDHVTVVGPARYGKSVILSHLAQHFRRAAGIYLTTVYVDLRHGTPTSDSLFKRRLAEEIRSALQPLKPDLAESIIPSDEGIHELLGMVFDELAGAGERLLVFLDGFDHVMTATGLTRQIWDDLRSLAQRSSLRCVTGSRRPLRELCRTEASQTSDFWEIFNPSPVRVRAFTETDWDPIIRPLIEKGLGLDISARKEIANWTGGIPILVCSLLERLWQHAGAVTTFSKTDVDQVAETLLTENRELLETIWSDLSVEMRENLATLSERETTRSELSDEHARILIERGLAVEGGGRYRASCRLMSRFAAQKAPGLAEIRRLFGTAEGFEKNIRTMLELRLAQLGVTGIDPELLNLVSKSVRDLEPDPAVSLTWARQITERAFNLVWSAELPPDRKMPDEWVNAWSSSFRFSPEWLRPEAVLPRKCSQQCQVLRLLTGTENVSRLARKITKTTYLVIEHMQSIGDFGQHRHEFPETQVKMDFASSVALSAVALLESISRDLNGNG